MNTSLRDRLLARWWSPSVLAVAVFITLGAGFCVFDADHAGNPDHAVSLDLCLGMLVASVTVIPLARLPLTGWAAPYHPVADLSPAITTPVPPPKSRSAV